MLESLLAIYLTSDFCTTYFTLPGSMLGTFLQVVCSTRQVMHLLARYYWWHHWNGAQESRQVFFSALDRHFHGLYHWFTCGPGYLCNILFLQFCQNYPPQLYKRFFQEIFCIHGFPCHIVSDQGGPCVNLCIFIWLSPLAITPRLMADQTDHCQLRISGYGCVQTSFVWA